MLLFFRHSFHLAVSQFMEIDIHEMRTRRKWTKFIFSFLFLCYLPRDERGRKILLFGSSTFCVIIIFRYKQDIWASVCPTTHLLFHAADVVVILTRLFFSPMRYYCYLRGYERVFVGCSADKCLINLSEHVIMVWKRRKWTTKIALLLSWTEKNNKLVREMCFHLLGKEEHGNETKGY